MTFMAPTLVRDNPVERIPRLTETNISVEWNMSSPMKPAVVIKVPKMIGLNEPNLETMKPEVGPKINSTIANGSCTLPALMASSPNPTGSGFLTSMGTV